MIPINWAPSCDPRTAKFRWRLAMPTVLRSEGLRVVVYPNDHPPAHIHVLGPGWAVVIDLLRFRVREAINCGEREVRQAMRLTVEHRNELINAWKRYHG